MPDPILSIILDTRESAPAAVDIWRAEVLRRGWGFEIGTIGEGDFMAAGYDLRIERKALADAVSSFAGGREREMRKVERLARHARAAYVIEAWQEDLEPYLAELWRLQQRKLAHPPKYPQSPQVLLSALRVMFARYGIASIWAGDTAGAAHEACELARHFAIGIQNNPKEE